MCLIDKSFNCPLPSSVLCLEIPCLIISSYYTVGTMIGYIYSTHTDSFIKLKLFLFETSIHPCSLAVPDMPKRFKVYLVERMRGKKLARQMSKASDSIIVISLGYMLKYFSLYIHENRQYCVHLLVK